MLPGKVEEAVSYDSKYSIDDLLVKNERSFYATLKS